MPITAENLVRHELIGLKVRIKKSKDPSHEKLRGKVIDESYKMIKIEGKMIGEARPKEKSIPKRNTVFMFTLPDGERVEVDGALLVSRPEDRIKKKFDKW
jgi:ribonuclease P protein subunit POP4